MDIAFNAEETAFQALVRDTLKTKFPQDICEKARLGQTLTKDDFVRSQKILNELGWAVVNWPEEYGGPGWTATQRYIFENEMANAHVPRVIPFGINMVAPVIYTFGSDEQKKRFLPDIQASNVWWCQGYSEPGSGSDLASLSTKAMREGDHYIVTGSKTWTTMAQHADWIFCLVRTEKLAKKQEGISFLLIDMTSKGIVVNPIITIEGGHEVNEVHFDEVRVPVANLVGEEGKGWTYAKYLLTHERTGIAGVARSKETLRSMRAYAANEPSGYGQTMLENADFQRRMSDVEIELMALEYTELRTLASVQTGGSPGPESSILKIRGTEIQQALTELFVELAGNYALPFLPDYYAAGSNVEAVGPHFAAQAGSSYFNFRKASIYGGSNEIQKNIIAKAVLGL